MNINKSIELILAPGRYDCSGNIYFDNNCFTVAVKLGVESQIEILETMKDSLTLNESENTAFDIVIETLYASAQIKAAAS